MALRSLLTRKTLTLGGNPQFIALGLRGLKTFTLPDLPYDYGALEPAISGEIMQLHHQKHHQTYITNYNKALEQLDQAMNKGDASTVVKLQSAIKFNGGGQIFVFFFLFIWWVCACFVELGLVRNLRCFPFRLIDENWRGFDINFAIYKIVLIKFYVSIWKITESVLGGHWLFLD